MMREKTQTGQALVAARGQDLAEELSSAREQHRLLESQLAEREIALAEARNHSSRLARDLDDCESSRQRANQTAADAKRDLAEASLLAERTGIETQEWIARAGDLTDYLKRVEAERDTLQFHLDAMCASPGWRFLEGYRGWLRKSRWRHRWVDRTWEPAVQWVLRRTGLTGQTGQTSASLRAPLPIPPSAQQFAATPNRRQHSATLTSPPDRPVNEIQNDAGYAAWILETEPGGIELLIQRTVGACFSYQPKISVLVPVYRVPAPVLREMVESVISQTYYNWELCLAIAGQDDPECITYLEDASRREARIHLVKLAANEGISGNSNRALELATGEFAALLDHDDVLAPSALFEVVQLLNQFPDTNFISSDKDLLTGDGLKRIQPLFKPQWSPDLMFNANYLTHLCVMRTEHIRAVGGWRKETDGAQDWDIFLRVIQQYGQVRHIPKVLYHWRQLATSVASGRLHVKPYAPAGQVRAVGDHLKALGIGGCGLTHEQGSLRVAWPLAEGRQVSVIFLAADGGEAALDQAAEIASATDHPSFEFVVPVSQGQSRGLVRAVATGEGVVDLRARIDAAVLAARGTVLVFLDEAAKPAEPSWLREITGPLQVPGVGLVGARLEDPRTGAVRHCGIVFTPDGRYEYIYSGYPSHVFEQFGPASWYRNWSAVSGACFAISADLWAKVGGPADPLLHPRLDLHVCLKLALENRRIFYNPYARFLQERDSLIESQGWGAPGPAAGFLSACFADGDPYFNPNLDCRGGRVLYKLPEPSGQLPASTDFAGESRLLLQMFDCPPARIERSRNASSKAGTGRMDTVTWLLPDFSHPFYGGIHTILRFADAFQRRHGVKSNFCVLGRSPEVSVRRRIEAAFPELAASCGLSVVDDPARVARMPRTDAVVSTLWTTAYAALEFDARRKFYFIQDDEALFYPAGSTSALVEATYGFGMLGLCNTPSLLSSYQARGGEGEYFRPCIDPAVFHDRGRKAEAARPPYTLFCYARPSHPRNCFELLSVVLRMLKERFGDDLTIVTAGAEWDLRAYGLKGVVHHLGLLNYPATGALYRACDAGLVMMMTRHPSYLPMELMGCGSLVITNRNPDTAWLLRDGENCLLAPPTPASLADSVEHGLRNVELRRKIVANAREMVQADYVDWDAPIEKIWQYMRRQC